MSNHIESDVAIFGWTLTLIAFAAVSKAEWRCLQVGTRTDSGMMQAFGSCFALSGLSLPCLKLRHRSYLYNRISRFDTIRMSFQKVMERLLCLIRYNSMEEAVMFAKTFMRRERCSSRATAHTSPLTIRIDAYHQSRGIQNLAEDLIASYITQIHPGRHSMVRLSCHSHKAFVRAGKRMRRLGGERFLHRNQPRRTTRASEAVVYVCDKWLMEIPGTEPSVLQVLRWIFSV